jgi:hypothetical protein
MSGDLLGVLSRLGRHNPHEISDRRLHYDVDQLIEVLDRALGAAKPSAEQPREASSGSPLP